MSAIFRTAFVVTALALGGLLTAHTSDAWAMDYQQAKAQGLVGERPDGLIGAVNPNADADVQTLVRDINNKRLQVMQGIAAQNGTSLQAVQAITGEKQIQTAPPGTFVMTPSGQWVRR